MSERDGSNSDQFGAVPEHNVAAATTEISSVLATIAEMMAESERRQATAMLDMQTRIGELAASAQSTGTNVPSEFRGAFQQIEEAMAHLADRIATNSRNIASSPASTSHDQQQTGTTSTAVPPTAPTGHEDALSTLAKMLAGDQHRFAPVEIEAPLTQQANSSATEIAVQAAVAIEASPAGNPDDPWDEATAEQLTKLYESGEAGLPTAGITGPAGPVTVHSAPAMMPAPQTTIVQGITAQDRVWLDQQFSGVRSDVSDRPHEFAPQDREWLTTQFARIAENVEQSLSQPDNSASLINLIEGCLEDFETRYHNAIEGFANSYDPSSLKEIEACIVEFSTQLEKSQSELSRIESLEDEIRQLASRLSEERLQALTSKAAQPQDGFNPEQIAEFVAHHVAERSAKKVAEILPAPSQGPDATTEALSGVKGLLNNLIIEHRNEGKQTTDRLEAMQQDMIRLLKRVDGIDTAPAQPPRPSQARQTPTLGSALPNPQPAQPPQSAASTIDTPAKPAPAEETHPAPAAQKENATNTGPQAPDRANFMAQARRAAAQENDRVRQQTTTTDAPVTAHAAESSDQTTETKQEKTIPAAKASSQTAGMRLAVAALAVITIGLGAGSLVLDWPNSKGKSNISTTIDQTPAKPGTPKKEKAAAPSDKSKSDDANGSNLVAPRTRVTAGLSNDTLPAGVALTPAANRINADNVARHQRAQEMAALSTKVGASQPIATALPASLIPTEPKPESSATGHAVSQLNRKLPTALVGPLSLRLAAADGMPSASFEVGARFAEGKGVRQDFKEAAKWYSQAASKGFALAQYRLATLFERGLGVDTDLARAKIWYERAARQGNVKAMHNLAVLIAGGKVGATDYGSAARWFTEASERGLADSQFNLAILYENGLGVSKDLSGSALQPAPAIRMLTPAAVD